MAGTIPARRWFPTKIQEKNEQTKKLTNKTHEQKGFSFYATAEISTTKRMKTIICKFKSDGKDIKKTAILNDSLTGLSTSKKYEATDMLLNFNLFCND